MAKEGLPSSIKDVITPCLVVDIDQVKRNSQAMIDRCQSMGIKLRPHMKTHKCREIGEITTGGTKKCIAVSTLKEAEYFADGGFDDILCTAIFTADKIPRMQQLSQQLEAFHVMVDNICGVSALEASPIPGKKWSVFLKVDCGDNRAGVLWNTDAGVELAEHINSSPVLAFQGMYVHEGNSYDAHGVEEAKRIAEESTHRLLHLAKRIHDKGIPCNNLGLGATPSCSHPAEIMHKLTELHPGNYTFYDVMQSRVPSCSVSDIAIRVVTRVIGHYRHRNQMLIDVGWTAISQDGKGALENGSYCLIDEHPELRLIKMSQEVGFIDCESGDLDYDKYPIGSPLFLIPYHACAAAAMHNVYYIHSGGQITDRWSSCSGW